MLNLPQRLEKSLYDTLLKSDFTSVIQNAGEIGFDSLLDEGLLKDIPVLNWILAVGKTWGNARDYLFAKKMFAFLQDISSLTENERRQLIPRLDTDEKFGKYAGEQIIELLSRIDSERKAILVATALKLYAREEIDSVQLQRINYAIDRFMLCDTDAFRSFCNKGNTDADPATANFINAGLAYVPSGHSVGGVSPTETAPLFLQVLEEGL